MGKETKRHIGIFCSLFMYFLYVVLLTVRTKMLIFSYGSEVNAVFQTSGQIFTYLILLESGIGAAYQFKLYAPVNCKDIKKIAGLFAGLKKSMQKIAIRMTVVLFVISVVYPFIMDRVSVSFVKAGLILFLLGIRFIIPYFVSIASKTLLSVYDYKYVADNVDSLGYIVITAVEICAIRLLHWPVYSVLLIGCIGNLLIGLVYAFLIQRACVGIQEEKTIPDFEPEGMTKDILFHQIAGLLNNNIDIIILSIVNIMLVTPYHSYYSTMYYFPQVMNKINENYRTKIGMKIKQHDQSLYGYFQLLLAFHMVVAIVSAAVFVLNINSFIYLWIGKEFLLSNTCVILLALYLVLRMTINIVFLVRDGAGLYKESKWFSFGEGIVNLILSIILVQFWGIEGILFATVFATYTMLMPGNAKLAYNKVMGKRNTLWMDYLITIITAACLILGFGGFAGQIENISWEILTFRLVGQTLVCTVIAVLVVVIAKWKYISRYLWKKGKC